MGAEAARSPIDQVRCHRGQAGFTLIEFLVVVGVLSILAGVVVFAVGKARDNAARNACESERATFETASNASSVDPTFPIASYLKAPQGVYFEVTGSSSFSRRAASQFTNDCVLI